MSSRQRSGDEVEVEVVALFPPWKEAVKKFRESQFQPGELIPEQWFWDAFGEVDPDSETTIVPLDYKRRTCFFMQQLQLLQDSLLEEDDIALKNVYGKGYEVVPPKQQTKFALTRAKGSIGRELRRAGKTLEHVKLAELSLEEQRERTEAICKIAALAGMTRKLPSPF